MQERFEFAEVFSVLNKEQVGYVIVGGLAVILHGYLRATTDLDIVLALEQENLSRAIRAFERLSLKPLLPVSFADFANPDNRADWLANKNMQVLQLWDPKNPLRQVDIFVHEPIPFTELNQQAVGKLYHGVKLNVASIDHLIEMKRIAGRQRDTDDIIQLQKIQQLNEK